MPSSLYRRIRNYGCRIYDDVQFKGHRSLLLENDQLQICLLLDKGAEPVRWLHKQTDTDLIWFTKRNLLPSHALYADYQMNYFGGWQEMLPEVSETHIYRGATLHRGESAILPWDYRILNDDPGEVVVQLIACMQSMPLRIEKTISLSSGSSKVRIDETVRNESPAAALEINWGHHLAYGPPFLQESSVVSLHQSATVHHPLTGEQWNWPMADQGGQQVDLSRMPPRGTKRDLLYVLSPDGEYTVAAPDRGIALKVRWDQRVWPYLWYWQNFQNDLDHPFYGCDYNIGLEMFNVPPKLTVSQSVEAGLALQIPPAGSLSSWVEFDLVNEKSDNT